MYGSCISCFLLLVSLSTQKKIISGLPSCCDLSYGIKHLSMCSSVIASGFPTFIVLMSSFKPGSHVPWESPFCSEQFNCFFPFGDSYRIGFILFILQRMLRLYGSSPDIFYFVLCLAVAICCQHMSPRL